MSAAKFMNILALKEQQYVFKSKLDILTISNRIPIINSNKLCLLLVFKKLKLPYWVLKTTTLLPLQIIHHHSTFPNKISGNYNKINWLNNNLRVHQGHILLNIQIKWKLISKIDINNIIIKQQIESYQLMKKIC